MAFLFWPDSSEEQALANLRNLLFSLRRALPIIARRLYADRNSLQWTDTLWTSVENAFTDPWTYIGAIPIGEKGSKIVQQEIQTLFETIFSDAHLVDIDLSAWDKSIALYVLADHVERTADGHVPMFIVEFTGVHNWNIDFNHLTSRAPIKLNVDEHVQWIIYDYSIERDGGLLEIMLRGHAASPRMTFSCDGINIQQISTDTPDRNFPGWREPSHGFIRPGLSNWNESR
jgi:hypothetical protein